MYHRDPYTFANQAAIPAPILRVTTAVLKSWDTPSDDSFLSHFSSDGVVELGPSPTKGRAAIKALRDGMINPKTGPVVGVQHYFDRCFVLHGLDASGNSEVVMTGTIENRLSDGRTVACEYATWAVLEDPVLSGELKAARWKVYMDASNLREAIRELDQAK